MDTRKKKKRKVISYVKLMETEGPEDKTDIKID